jgi:hypothetical protein
MLLSLWRWKTVLRVKCPSNWCASSISHLSFVPQVWECNVSDCLSISSHSNHLLLCSLLFDINFLIPLSLTQPTSYVLWSPSLFCTITFTRRFLTFIWAVMSSVLPRGSSSIANSAVALKDAIYDDCNLVLWSVYEQSSAYIQIDRQTQSKNHVS